jgi:hypothetical protein
MSVKGEHSTSEEMVEASTVIVDTRLPDAYRAPAFLAPRRAVLGI